MEFCDECKKMFSSNEDGFYNFQDDTLVCNSCRDEIVSNLKSGEISDTIISRFEILDL